MSHKHGSSRNWEVVPGDAPNVFGEWLELIAAFGLKAGAETMRYNSRANLVRVTRCFRGEHGERMVIRLTIPGPAVGR